MAPLYLTIAAPLLGAVLAAAPLHRRARVGVGILAGALLLAGAIATPLGDVVLKPDAQRAVETVGDSALILYFLWVAWRRRSALAAATGLVNAALFVWVLHIGLPSPAVVLHVDGLSRFFLLVIAAVAPAVWIWAPFYHEHRRPISEGPYYFWLYAIVGVMALLVTANDLMDLYLLWELTTLASFLLIDAPRSEEARAASIQALWMNGVGGAAFLTGVIVAGNLSLAQVGQAPAALLALAATVKAAQLPFSRWLLGAMAAPSPVSALLHSSTMVKAGVYLALRLAPVLHLGPGGPALAWAGGISFLGAAWLASGSRRTKEVLAYSTISNLGLMLAMAGLGTPAALAAALALVLFHAAGKALLFLVAGSVEADLGSRDLEAAGGLMEVRPALGFLGIWGVASLYMPPLGLLIAKWQALEAAAGSLGPYALIAVGSALTAFFWTKVVGRFACAEATPAATDQHLPGAAYGPLWYLAAMVAVGSVGFGLAPPWDIVGLTAAVVAAAVSIALARSPRPRAAPYLSGVEADLPGHFRSSGDADAVAALTAFYPSPAWEAASERVFTAAGLLALVAMVAVVL